MGNKSKDWCSFLVYGAEDDFKSLQRKKNIQHMQDDLKSHKSFITTVSNKICFVILIHCLLVTSRRKSKVLAEFIVFFMFSCYFSS